MGQPIADNMRTRITALPHVAEVTRDHIVLINGLVLDPQEFVVSAVAHRFICKLRQCHCWFRPHQAGMHVMVQGVIQEFADGRKQNKFDWPSECPNGDWTLEEVVPFVKVRQWRPNSENQLLPSVRLPASLSGRVRLPTPNGNGTRRTS